MTFQKRLIYFLFGIALGLALVIFIFRNRNLPKFWPKDKIRSELLSKTIIKTDAVSQKLNQFNVSDSSLKALIRQGEIDLSQRIKTDDTCKYYRFQLDSIQATFAICKNKNKLLDINKITTRKND